MTLGWRKIHVFVAILATLSMQACAPTKPPVEELDAASRSLATARSAGAQEYAPADYRVAGQRYQEAQAAEASEDYDAATQLARESVADAELASARARLGKARETVQKLRQDNAGLDRDLVDHPSPEAQP